MKSIILKPGIPKYQQLTDHFMEAIETGQLQVGDSLPSLGELRAELGISQATFDKVHRLLEAEGLVSRERGRGSFVLRGKKARASSVIGYFQPEFDKLQHHAYFTRLLAGIRRAAQVNDQNVLLIGQPAKFTDWDYIGAAVFCLDNIEMRTLCPDMPDDLPTVRSLYPMPDTPTVQADEEAGQKEAVEQLLRLGHRRIAYMARFHETGIQPRLNGYRKALGEHGIVPEDSWFCSFEWILPHLFDQENFPKNGYLNMKRWLQHGFAANGCTALMVQNDVIALGVLDALREAGIRVPEDLSVVGFDGVDTFQRYSRRLSTVKVPLEEIGEKAVQLLADPSISNETILQFSCEFVPGETIAPPRKS